MKRYVVSSVLASSLLVMLFSSRAFAQVETVPADSVAAHAARYVGKTVAVEGTVVHMCGVDGKKMKVKASGGAMLKVVPNATLYDFDFALNAKRVRVVGVVQETRLDSAFADKLEQEQALPCSIDKAPCIDKGWVAKEREKGTAAAMSKEAVARLRAAIASSGVGYVSLVTIVAQKVEVLE
jgi:hypothetical protein